MPHQFTARLLHTVAAPTTDQCRGIRFPELFDKITAVQIPRSFTCYNVITHWVKIGEKGNKA
jgi:hypothetical protein